MAAGAVAQAASIDAARLSRAARPKILVCDDIIRTIPLQRPNSSLELPSRCDRTYLGPAARHTEPDRTSNRNRAKAWP